MITWVDRPSHRHWLHTETLRLLDFGRDAVTTDRGAGWLDDGGVVDTTRPIFTWVTARTAHVYALGHLLGIPGSRAVATRALAALRRHCTTGRVWRLVRLDCTGRHARHRQERSCARLRRAGRVDRNGGRARRRPRPAGRSPCSARRALLGDRCRPHADEWDRTWNTLDPYRGVNSNMHAVEALLAAGDATGDVRWHERAATIANHLVTWAAASHLAHPRALQREIIFLLLQRFIYNGLSAGATK